MIYGRDFQLFYVEIQNKCLCIANTDYSFGCI